MSGGKRGFTLIAALFIMMVMALLAVTLSTFVSSDSVIAIKNYHSQDAFYIASSGLEYYSRLLVEDPDWSTPPADKVKPFSGGVFIVETTEESRNRITLTVTGLVTIGATTYRRAIQPTLQRTGGGLGAILDNYVLYWGGGGGSGSTIGNNTTIIGSFYTGATVEVGNNVNISGDAQSAGNIDLGQNTSVDGTVETYVEAPYDAPSLETTYYDGQITIASTHAAGNRSYDSRSFSGTTYVKGNVTFNSNSNITITGSATIVATGTVRVRNNVRFGDNLTVIAGGKVTIDNNCDIGKSGLWYSSVGFEVGNNAEVSDISVGEGTIFITPGDIDFGNNIEFYGFIYCGGDFVQTGNNFYFEGNMIVGGDINVDNNTTLVLNPDLVDQADLIGITAGEYGGEDYDLVGWDEVY